MKYMIIGCLIISAYCGAVNAATCEPGYYLENGECIICPMHYACPDGESKIICSLGNPAQYTAGPGATECIDCPTTLLHPEGFTHYWSNRGLYESDGLQSCRAAWDRRTEHGLKRFSCSAGDSGYYDNDEDKYPKCMLDTVSCDAGYVTRIQKNDGGNYRIWLSSYPKTDNLEVCKPAGIGFYSADGEIEATACQVGTSTRTDTAASADECLPLCTGGATKFHVGENVFNIWRDKYTSPTLKVELPSGVVCHINLAPGVARGTVNVDYKGQTYHITN